MLFLLIFFLFTLWVVHLYWLGLVFAKEDQLLYQLQWCEKGSYSPYTIGRLQSLCEASDQIYSSLLVEDVVESALMGLQNIAPAMADYSWKGFLCSLMIGVVLGGNTYFWNSIFYETLRLRFVSKKIDLVSVMKESSERIELETLFQKAEHGPLTLEETDRIGHFISNAIRNSVLENPVTYSELIQGMNGGHYMVLFLLMGVTVPMVWKRFS